MREVFPATVVASSQPNWFIFKKIKLTEVDDTGEEIKEQSADLTQTTKNEQEIEYYNYLFGVDTYRAAVDRLSPLDL